MTKTIPKENKSKTKWLPVEALQIPEERREVKSKGEGERYIQLNGKIQRIARRNKKAFLNEQYKEIEENNRIGKNKDLFKKIGDIKETFHARMGTIMGKNDKDLKEAEEIKKNWQEYTDGLSKKGLKDPDNHDGVVTHIKSDIL